MDFLELELVIYQKQLTTFTGVACKSSVPTVYQKGKEWNGRKENGREVRRKGKFTGYV